MLVHTCAQVAVAKSTSLPPSAVTVVRAAEVAPATYEATVEVALVAPGQPLNSTQRDEAFQGMKVGDPWE